MNSSGDNSLQIGPMSLGLMHTHWQAVLQQAGYQFTAIEGLGTGVTDEIVPRAQREILRILSTKANDAKDYVLIGHSQGGLVSRVLVHNPMIRERIRRVVTVGTPHHGAWLAEAAMRLVRAQALLPKTTRIRNQHIVTSSLTKEKMNDFNFNFPPHQDVRYASALTMADAQHRNPFLRLLSPLQNEAGDGVVSLKSQTFGESIGPFQLDHLAQLGFTFGTSKTEKTRTAQEFERMTQAILKWLES